MLELENPFWTFSLDIYARPGVAEECLGLQARHGIDVNALLFCAWAGAVRRALLNERHTAGIVARVEAWQRETVLPLRTVRRALKDMVAVGEAMTALRKDVAAAELRAEQIEQAMLFADAAALLGDAVPASAEEAVPANLACFCLGHHGAAADRLGAAAMAFATEHAGER